MSALALSEQSNRIPECPLLEVKRTWRLHWEMSAFGPKARFSRCAVSIRRQTACTWARKLATSGNRYDLLLGTSTSVWLVPHVCAARSRDSFSLSHRAFGCTPNLRRDSLRLDPSLGRCRLGGTGPTRRGVGWIKRDAECGSGRDGNN
jgi:hypothetical protein